MYDVRVTKNVGRFRGVRVLVYVTPRPRANLLR